jgi:hypothetical protein
MKPTCNKRLEYQDMVVDGLLIILQTQDMEKLRVGFKTTLQREKCYKNWTCWFPLCERPIWLSDTALLAVPRHYQTCKIVRSHMEAAATARIRWGGTQHVTPPPFAALASPVIAVNSDPSLGQTMTVHTTLLPAQRFLHIKPPYRWHLQWDATCLLTPYQPPRLRSIEW